MLALLVCTPPEGCIWPICHSSVYVVYSTTYLLEVLNTVTPPETPLYLAFLQYARVHTRQHANNIISCTRAYVLRYILPYGVIGPTVGPPCSYARAHACMHACSMLVSRTCHTLCTLPIRVHATCMSIILCVTTRYWIHTTVACMRSYAHTLHACMCIQEEHPGMLSRRIWYILRYVLRVMQ